MKTAFCALLLAHQANAFSPASSSNKVTARKMAKSNEEGPLMGRNQPKRQQAPQQKLVQSNNIGDSGGWSGLDLSDGQLGAFGRSSDNAPPRAGINSAPVPSNDGYQPPPEEPINKEAAKALASWSGLDLNDSQLGTFGRTKQTQPKRPVYAAPPPDDDEEDPAGAAPKVDGEEGPLVVVGDGDYSGGGSELPGWGGLQLNDGQLGAFGRTREEAQAAMRGTNSQPGRPPNSQPGRPQNSQAGRPQNSQAGRGSFAAPDDGMRSGGRNPPPRQRAPPAAESHKIDIGNLMDGSQLNNPQAGSFSQNKPKPRGRQDAGAQQQQQQQQAPPRRAAKPVAEWSGLNLSDGQLGAFGRTKETQPTWSVNGPPDGMPPPEENLGPASSDEAAQALASWSGLDLNDGQLGAFGRTKETQPKRPVYAAPPPVEKVQPQARAPPQPVQSQQGMPPVQSQQGMPPVQSQQGMPPVQSQQGMPPVQSQQGVPPVQSQQGAPPSAQQESEASQVLASWDGLKLNDSQLGDFGRTRESQQQRKPVEAVANEAPRALSRDARAQMTAANQIGSQAKDRMDDLLQTPNALNFDSRNTAAAAPSDPAAVRLEAEARVNELLKAKAPQTSLAQQGFATQGEIEAIRLEAKTEMKLLEKDFEAREKSLVTEIAQLSLKVSREEENVVANHKMKNRILETRIELDKELATLRKEYNVDKKKWEAALLEQEKLHNHQLHSSQRDFNKLQDELNVMRHEYELAKSNSAFTNPTKLANAETAANVIFQQRADATLTAEKDKLQAGMMKAQEARAKIESELTALKRKYEYDSHDWKQTMARELAERDKIVEGKAAEYETVNSEMSKAAEVLETRDEELAQFKADSVTLHALLTTFQEERINMEGELNLLKARYEEDHLIWQQRMADEGLARAAQEAEIANLTAQISKMLEERVEPVEKRSLAEKVSSFNQNVAKQKAIVKTLRAEIAEMKEENNKSSGNTNIIKAMSLELETREQELATQRKEIEHMRAEMTEMNKERLENEGLAASLKKMTAVLATRDQELSRQDVEMVELRDAMTAMKNQRPDIEDQLASIKPLTDELAAREKAFFKQKAELKKLQATLTQIHEERAEVDGQLASINIMSEELEARDRDEIKQKVKMEKLQSEITKLKQKRADADGDATKLRTMTRNLAARDKELTKQKTEVDRLRAQMTKLEKERKAENNKPTSSRMGNNKETAKEKGEKAKMQIELTKMKVERAKMDSELATLKKEHEQERLHWESQNVGGQGEAEKLAEQKAKLEQLRAEMASVKEERNDVGSFFDRAVGSFFGSND